MKKFYVSPIFPLILGIVAFGVLSVQLVFVTNTLVTLFLLLLIWVHIVYYSSIREIITQRVK